MKKRMIILALFTPLFLTACTGQSSNGLTRLEGQITWQDGGTLPQNSQVRVMIVNASLADATEILAETSFSAQGSPPLDFFVSFDPPSVDQRMNYSATVRIEDADGNLLYVTMTAQFVIERGEIVQDITILVEPV